MKAQLCHRLIRKGKIDGISPFESSSMPGVKAIDKTRDRIYNDIIAVALICGMLISSGYF